MLTSWPVSRPAARVVYCSRIRATELVVT
jgi:hypothetical protein